MALLCGIDIAPRRPRFCSARKKARCWAPPPSSTGVLAQARLVRTGTRRLVGCNGEGHRRRLQKGEAQARPDRAIGLSARCTAACSWTKAASRFAGTAVERPADLHRVRRDRGASGRPQEAHRHGLQRGPDRLHRPKILGSASTTPRPTRKPTKSSCPKTTFASSSRVNSPARSATPPARSCWMSASAPGTRACSRSSTSTPTSCHGSMSRPT